MPVYEHVPFDYGFLAENFHAMKSYLARIDENRKLDLYHPITSHRRFGQRLVFYVKRVMRRCLKWLLVPIFSKQSDFNANSAEAMKQIGAILESTRSESLQKMEQLSSSYHDLVKGYQDLVQGQRDLESTLFRHLRVFESNQLYFAYRLRVSNHELESHNNATSLPSAEGKSEQGNFDYFVFENKFSGPIEDIKRLQEKYVKYFLDKGNVLDIGCGRGEFLGLLAENGIHAVGIDINSDFVGFCKNHGLEVCLSDALDYLNSVPDNSVGGIFMGHVIEHLHERYIYKLFETAYRKLMPGSSFVIEAPNVPSVIRLFYQDLSHIKPVHPDTVRFLFEYFGYGEIEVMWNEKVDINIPDLSINVPEINRFNEAMKHVNQIVFGAQDYAVVGKKL